MSSKMWKTIPNIPIYQTRHFRVEQEHLILDFFIQLINGISSGCKKEKKNNEK